MPHQVEEGRVDELVLEGLAEPGRISVPFLPQHLLAVHVTNKFLVIVFNGQSDPRISKS